MTQGKGGRRTNAITRHSERLKRAAVSVERRIEVVRGNTLTASAISSVYFRGAPTFLRTARPVGDAGRHLPDSRSSLSLCIRSSSSSVSKCTPASIFRERNRRGDCTKNARPSCRCRRVPHPRSDRRSHAIANRFFSMQEVRHQTKTSSAI
uniref:Uncharacterized protein n=1 Tax=Toxoplasma gondii COUG TaxID=1074873 RepID=A0A2G8Y184_TOXGO|nr:hypothetical protein TGCOUG_269050B [Toxoplasma gondii COUG]